MLSQENINKLHNNGLYKCEPVLSWLPAYKRDNPYWCRNWTFKVRNHGNKYYMYDTYWSTGDENPIELTDENFDKFELMFDLDKIKFINAYQDWLEYPEKDRWRVAIDNGGLNYAKYVVRKDAKKLKTAIIERLQRDIDYLHHDLALKEHHLRGMIDGTVPAEIWQYY